ncbi:amino acid transporter [Gemmatimonadetes bacterium T265]|nr:amino acid transporter [Gemmatimonadetes bacterium T265]
MPALHRRFGVGAALAMVVAEVLGVGIFLTPAGMARTLGTSAWVLAVWGLVGLCSAAGALCYAELGTRFPEAGGGYVYLREAFGARAAFVYGWMSLLVMDPGLTAALGVGLAQYLLALLDGPAALAPMVAVACILGASTLTVFGVERSARVLRWTAVAKLGAVALLVGAAALHGSGAAGALAHAHGPPPASALAGAFIGAFFAFGGWWDLGKMGEEVVDPRRTLPTALVGGVGVVTLVYAAVSLAFLHAVQGSAPATDGAFVTALGSALFGRVAAPLLSVAVVVAVAGSLVAVLLGAPRVYLAMARSGVAPAALVRFDPRRQSTPVATAVQVALACVLVTFGNFDQILGYFVPAAVFFLGLSAAALFRLPRPDPATPVFRAPWHPLPVVVFLALVAAILVLSAVGRPVQTLLGAGVVALGVPVSWLLVGRRPRSTADAPGGGA